MEEQRVRGKSVVVEGGEMREEREDASRKE